MINTNQIQVSQLFNNPENQHQLLVYEPIDFDNENQALIVENTNNNINLKFIKTLWGAFINTSLGPQVKVIDEITNSIGLKINTDYVFITNDDCSFLEKTNKTYFFTINKVLNKDVPVYFIGENSIKSFTNIDDENLKLDQLNLNNLWSISLQSINKLSISKNSKIYFDLVEEIPTKESSFIQELNYRIYNNSLIQSIQVVGDIVNIKTNEIKKNVNLNLENTTLYTNSYPDGYTRFQFLPLFISFQNLYQKSVINVRNFDPGFQLNYHVVDYIYKWNNNPSLKETLIENIFKIYTNDTQAEELMYLFFKIVSLSWAFNTNFNVYFNKTNDNFIKYFNANYANIEPQQYMQNVINDFITKFPNIPNDMVWNVFKALCMSCSDILICPYSWGGGGVQSHKKALWYYLNIKVEADSYVKYGFDESGRFIDKTKIILSVVVDSLFFDLKYDKNIDQLILKNKNPFMISKMNNYNFENKLINYPYLPNKITEINPDIPVSEYDQTNNQLKYLVYQTFANDTELWNFLKAISGVSYKKIITTRIPTKFIAEDLEPEEFVNRFKPVNSRLVKVIDFKKENVRHITEWDSCIVPSIEPDKPNASLCIKYAEVTQEPDQNGKMWCNKIWFEQQLIPWPSCRWNSILEQKIFERPAKVFVEGWKYDVVVELEVSYYGNTKNLFTSEEYLEYINKNNIYYKNDWSGISFYLSKELIENGWRITRIRQDTFYSIFESASQLSLVPHNGTSIFDTKNYYRKESFQKLDNTICTTRTNY